MIKHVLHPPLFTHPRVVLGDGGIVFRQGLGVVRFGVEQCGLRIQDVGDGTFADSSSSSVAGRAVMQVVWKGPGGDVVSIAMFVF